MDLDLFVVSNLTSSSIVVRELELLVVVALLTESVVVTFLVVEARDQWICLRGMERRDLDHRMVAVLLGLSI